MNKNNVLTQILIIIVISLLFWFLRRYQTENYSAQADSVENLDEYCKIQQTNNNQRGEKYYTSLEACKQQNRRFTYLFDENKCVETTRKDGNYISKKDCEDDNKNWIFDNNEEVCIYELSPEGYATKKKCEDDNRKWIFKPEYKKCVNVVGYCPEGDTHKCSTEENCIKPFTRFYLNRNKTPNVCEQIILTQNEINKDSNQVYYKYYTNESDCIKREFDNYWDNQSNACSEIPKKIVDINDTQNNQLKGGWINNQTCSQQELNARTGNKQTISFLQTGNILGDSNNDIQKVNNYLENIEDNCDLTFDPENCRNI